MFPLKTCAGIFEIFFEHCNLTSDQSQKHFPAKVRYRYSRRIRDSRSLRYRKNKDGMFSRNQCGVIKYRYVSPTHSTTLIPIRSATDKVRLASSRLPSPGLVVSRGLSLILSRSLPYPGSPVPLLEVNVDVYRSSPGGPRIYHLVTRGAKIGLTRYTFDQPHEGSRWNVFSSCSRRCRARVFPDLRVDSRRKRISCK